MTEISLKRLLTCDERLQKLILKVDELFPVQVVCGYRGKEDQNKAFREKRSKLVFPKSKHNKFPSLAVDVVPDPDNNPKTLDWQKIEDFERMAQVIEAVAQELQVRIRLGRDFSFRDWPHVELV